VKHARAIHISGQTAADKKAVLSIRAGGIVAERPFGEGDPVKEGDLILSIDAAAKRAAVATAQQVLVQRESEAKAIERLAKAGSIPKLQLDNALSALAAAKSQLEAAQSELSALEVRAPFAGVVDRLDVEKGSSVLAGTPVAVLLALDPILAVGEVSESDLRHIEIGDKADVRLVSGQVFSGAIRYISREATSATRTFRVEITAPNPEDRIPAGMTAEVTIFADEVDAVILPRSVVTLSKTGDLGIRYVDAADKVAFQPIDLIDDTPEGLVLTGIPADARIIVVGQDLVAEGDIVRVVEPDLETLRRLAGDLSGSIR
ncbi:MAG: efflux RND transporter periplasmic adaptor subunit, partial [Rhizobiaceae bacterium]